MSGLQARTRPRKLDPPGRPPSELTHALSHLPSYAASNSRLDARLSRFLVAYLACSTAPPLLHVIFLLLVEWRALERVPFGVVATRWIITPLQGVVNLLVYWQQTGGRMPCRGLFSGVGRPLATATA